MKLSLWLVVAAIGASLGFAGCDSKKSRQEVVELGAEAESTPVAADGNDAVDSAATPDLGVADDPDAGGSSVFADTRLPGTPYDEEHHKLEVYYRGEAPGKITLMRSAGDTAGAAGRFEAEPDAKLDVKDSVVIVREPRKLTAKKEHRLPATKYDMLRGKFRGDSLLRVKAGDEFYLLKYEGEGTCFIGRETNVYHAPCPSTENFESEGWTGDSSPISTEWWIRVAEQGARGWVLVDGETLKHKVVKGK